MGKDPCGVQQTPFATADRYGAPLACRPARLTLGRGAGCQLHRNPIAQTAGLLMGTWDAWHPCKPVLQITIGLAWGIQRIGGSIALLKVPRDHSAAP